MRKLGFGYVDVWMFGYLDIWISAYLDIWISGYLNICIFGYLEIGIFGYLDISRAAPWCRRPPSINLQIYKIKYEKGVSWYLIYFLEQRQKRG